MFFLSQTEEQFVRNPIVSDTVQEWWEMAEGRGILQTNICMSYLKVACSSVRENLSPIRMKPFFFFGGGGGGEEWGEFKPFRIERRSESFAEEKIGRAHV